jgi:iron complex outermembrane receptor protein
MRLRFELVLCGALWSAAPAFAQEPAAISAVAQGPAAGESGVDEIVVTVERRAQDLQKVPSLAQALSGDDLKGAGVGADLRKLGVAVPGLSIANQEGNLEVFIRGVGSTNNTEIGDPAAATYLNGVYVPRPRGIGGQFFDLERVEILKGPQGTLRGRNAVAGALNIIARRPELGSSGGYLEAEFGSFASKVFEGAFNLPIGEKLALRASGYSEFRDSSFDNAGRSGNLDPAGEERERAGRLSALWQPSEQLALQITGDYSWEGGTGFPGANLFRAFSAGYRFEDLNPRKVLYRGAQGKLDSQHWGVQSNLTYDFGPVALEYLGSYRDLEFLQTNAASDGIRFPGLDLDSIDFDNFSNVFFLTHSRSNVQELRLFSPNGSRARWSVGLFYFNERQEAGFFSTADKGSGFSGTEFSIPDVKARSLAGYADLTYDVTPAFRVKAGIRRTDEEKSRFGIGGGFAIRAGGVSGDDPSACCFGTRFGTRGFEPRFLGRPSFDASDRSPSALARLLRSGVRQGGRDTLGRQLRGAGNGSRPGGTCVDTPDTDPGGALDCPPGGQFSFLQITAPDQQIGESKDKFLDWRAGLELDLAEQSLLYLTVTTGHKSGGFNDTVANPGFDASRREGAGNPRLLQAVDFKPEQVIAYELGSKNRFAWGERPITLNGSAFYYDYEDQVFSVLTAIGGSGGTQNGFSQQNVNIADSRIFGLELEGGIGLPAGFSLSGNLLWLRSEIRDATVSDVRATNFGNLAATPDADLSGNDLPLAPDWTAILKLAQELELASGARFDWQLLGNYKSSYFLSVFNQQAVRFDDDVDGAIDRAASARSLGFEELQRGFLTLNVGVGYTLPSQALRFEAFVSNLLDEDASTKAIFAPSLNLRFLNDPRTAGVRVRYSF